MAEYDPAEKARRYLKDWKCKHSAPSHPDDSFRASGEGRGASDLGENDRIGTSGEGSNITNSHVPHLEEGSSDDNLLLRGRPAAMGRRSDTKSRAACREELIRTIVRMGYPESFGTAIADNLRTEKMMTRMIAYLHAARPRSGEEIADEMLALMEDRQRWIQKKSAEYYNSRYNELLYYGLGEENE